MSNLFNELKRRNVVCVNIAYVVLGWVAMDGHFALAHWGRAPFWEGQLSIEQQGIDRPFISGPPYACKADQS
jgi:hypothetical protein